MVSLFQLEIVESSSPINGEFKPMLEAIARDLASQYQGRVITGSCIPDETYRSIGFGEFLYVAEMKDGFKLGFIPYTQRRFLVTLDTTVFDEGCGRKSLHICLADPNVEPVVKKHLQQHAPHYDITRVYMKRG